MSAVALNELKDNLAQKRAELKAVWEGFDQKTLADGTKAPVMTADQIKMVRERNDELSELSQKIESIESAMKWIAPEPEAPANRVGVTGMNERKSLSDFVFDSPQYKEAKGSSRMSAVTMPADQGFSLKSVLTTGTGYVVENTRDGDFVRYANNLQPNVINLVPNQRTDNETITYARQTERNNRASAKKEGQALEQSDFKVETVQDPLRIIGTYMDATLAQLKDVPQARALIDEEIPAFVREALEWEYLVGPGTGNHLTGVYNDPNIQSQATGTESGLDVIRKAIGKVEDYSADQRVNLIVVRPGVWRGIELMKTTDGQYIFANPTGMTAMRLWGYQVATSPNLATGTALVFDSRFFPLVYNDGMTIDWTDADGEKFQNLIVTVRAFVRAGLKHRRGQAACKVTGLTE